MTVSGSILGTSNKYRQMTLKYTHYIQKWWMTFRSQCRFVHVTCDNKTPVLKRFRCQICCSFVWITPKFNVLTTSIFGCDVTDADIAQRLAGCGDGEWLRLVVDGSLESELVCDFTAVVAPAHFSWSFFICPTLCWILYSQFYDFYEFYDLANSLLSW